MELSRLGLQEVIRITEKDDVLEYKISRTEDNRLILEIKVDISNSLLDVNSITEKTSQK